MARVVGMASQTHSTRERERLEIPDVFFYKIFPTLKHIFNIVKKTNEETHVYNLETQSRALGNIIRTMTLPVRLFTNCFETEAHVSKTGFELMAEMALSC